MVVREGVASLEKHISVPDALRDAKWTARPKGGGNAVPGPTDLELLAWFPIPDAERDAVLAGLGEPLGEAVVTFPAALSGALPDALRAERQGDQVALTGVRLPAAPFENIRWSASFAIAVPGGIAVYLHSK